MIIQSYIEKETSSWRTIGSLFKHFKHALLLSLNFLSFLPVWVSVIHTPLHRHPHEYLRWLVYGNRSKSRKEYGFCRVLLQKISGDCQQIKCFSQCDSFFSFLANPFTYIYAYILHWSLFSDVLMILCFVKASSNKYIYQPTVGFLKNTKTNFW